MQKTKPRPAANKKLYVPEQLHEQVRRLAFRQNENMTDFTARALEAGIKALRAPQVQSNPRVSAN